MAAHNKGTKHYSPSAAARAAPRPGRPRGTPKLNTTVDGELLAKVRARAEERGLTIAAVLDEALRAWLARG